MIMGCQFSIKEWLLNLRIKTIKPWIKKYESWSSFHILKALQVCLTMCVQNCLGKIPLGAHCAQAPSPKLMQWLSPLVS